MSKTPVHSFIHNPQVGSRAEVPAVNGEVEEEKKEEKEGEKTEEGGEKELEPEDKEGEKVYFI